MSESGREALPDVREWSGGSGDLREVSAGPTGCPGELWRPSHMYGSGREALPDVQKSSRGPSECPGVVGMP